eukprot:3143424-Prymnesium_polylepis.1
MCGHRGPVARKAFRLHFLIARAGGGICVSGLEYDCFRRGPKIIAGPHYDSCVLYGLPDAARRGQTRPDVLDARAVKHSPHLVKDER